MTTNTKKCTPEGEQKISFYLAWCKRCGNCVAFCPRKALAADEWGYPYLADPDKCTRCGLCEMLCPDFAISVAEPLGHMRGMTEAAKAMAPTTEELSQSPERLAPVEEDTDA